MGLSFPIKSLLTIMPPEIENKCIQGTIQAVTMYTLRKAWNWREKYG